MKIIGVDPGYDRCGFAIIEKQGVGKERLVHSECFQTNAKDAFEKRLLAVGERYEKLLNEFTPALCALEKVYFTKNQKTAMHVAEVRGALLYLSMRTKLQVVEYGPNEVKVAIAGNGAADKQAIMYMVPKLIAINHTITYDDEYDALAVALTASCQSSL